MLIGTGGGAITGSISGAVTIADLAGHGANVNAATNALYVEQGNLDPALDQVAVGTRASGGASYYHLVSAATTNATVVKASAGTLYGWQVINTNANPRYLKFHDASSTPTAGAAVVFPLGLPGGGGAAVSSLCGVAFATGIAFTTVTGSADSDTAAVGVGDLVIALWYA